MASIRKKRYVGQRWQRKVKSQESNLGLLALTAWWLYLSGSAQLKTGALGSIPSDTFLHCHLITSNMSS